MIDGFRLFHFKRLFKMDKIQLALGLLNLFYFSIGVFAGRLWVSWAGLFLFINIILIFAIGQYYKENKN